MITQFEKLCPVCGDKVIWIDVRSEPTTCSKKMCSTNIRYQKSHQTAEGYVRDLKDIGTWKS